MFLFKTLIALFIGLAMSTGNAKKIKKYKDCGSVGVLKWVDLTPCDKEPCVFHRGTNCTFSFDFIAKNATKKLTASVTAVIAGVNVTYPLPNPNACTSGVKCPVKAKDENIYKGVFPIKSFYPSIRFVVIYALQDDNGANTVCVEIPASVASTSSRNDTPKKLNPQPNINIV